MPAGPGLDRTGTLPPEAKRGLVNPSSIYKGKVGGLQSSRAATAATATRVFRSTLLPPSVLGNGFNFKLALAGLVGSDGTDDATIELTAVEPDGTAVKICDIVTVSLPDEDDKVCFIEFQGRVALEQVGATSGKIAAVGRIETFTGTPLRFAGASAAAGVAIDFRNGIYLEVRVAWDDTDATTILNILSALLDVCNLTGGEGQ